MSNIDRAIGDGSRDNSGLCHMCGRPSNIMYQGTNRWSINKEFCSRNCQDAYTGKLVASIGGGIIGFSLLFIITIQTPSAIIFLIIGLGIGVFGLYYMSLQAPDALERPDNIAISPTLEGEPQDQLIYSTILKSNVYPCCHQSARLNDKYCACGRVIEYPES